MRKNLAYAVLVLASAHVARAQSAPDGFALDRFQLSLDDDGILAVNSGRVPAHLSWSATAWIDGADNPLVLTSAATGESVSSIVSRRFTAGIGGTVAFFGRFEIGVALPVTVYQTGDALDSMMLPGLTSLPADGVGDLRIVPKLSLFARRGAELAVLPGFTVPLGSSGGFLREAGPTFSPELALSGSAGVFRYAIDAGVLLRQEVAIADRTAGDELYGRVGIALLPAGRRGSTELEAMATGANDLSDGSSAFEVMGGVTQALGRWRLVVAGGFGIGKEVGNPDWRVVAGVRLASGEGRAVIVTPPPVVPVTPPPRELDASLRVHVVGEDGSAVAGAKLHVAWSTGARDLETGSEGTAEATLDLPGEITVTTSKKGFKDEETRATIARAEAPTVVEVRLAHLPSGVIRGIVRSYDGRPLKGAAIHIEPAGIDARTDEVGVFEVEVPPGSHEVIIRVPGFEDQDRTIRVSDGGVTILNADMRRR